MLTALAMIAFAGNSLLCRAALASGAIDPGSFTLVRLAAGALALAGLVRVPGLGAPASSAPAAGTRPRARAGGDWPSALALFAYAAGFSFAYVRLPAATGALLLFGAVQATMILVGVAGGDRLGRRALAGLAIALGGLLALLLPGATVPAPGAAALMLGAGVAWGVYSLRGRASPDPLAQTAGNFARATLPAIVLGAVVLAAAPAVPRPAGLALAIASGAVASGVGYAIWYTALRHLTASRAATVQLSVPVIAALGGILLLGEPVTARLAGASVAVLGGIALSRS